MWIVKYREKSEKRESERRWEQKEGRLSGEKVTLGLGLQKNVLFILVFLSVGLGEPVRFGSVQSVSDFKNRNRTEPDFFCGFLIG
jgi:hypothetical protein